MDIVIVTALLIVFMLLLAPAAFLPLMEDRGLTTDPKSHRAPRAIDTFPTRKKSDDEVIAA